MPKKVKKMKKSIQIAYLLISWIKKSENSIRIFFYNWKQNYLKYWELLTNKILFSQNFPIYVLAIIHGFFVGLCEVFEVIPLTNLTIYAMEDVEN